MRAPGAPPGAALATALARFAPLALGVLGVALVLLRQANYGAGLTWDSAYYLSAAGSLAAGDGLVLWNGVPYAAAAPLFPHLLAAAELLGADAAAGARYLNAVAFGVTVFTVTAWLQRHVRSLLLATWAGCACALLPALVSAAAYAWTDMVFISCTVVSLALLDRFLSRPAPPTLLQAAAAAGAACLTRYVGAALLCAGALMLLLRTGADMRTRIRDVALWSAASLAPVGVWAVRNLLVIGSPFGTTFGDGFSALISLHRATGEFAAWLFGPTGFHLLNGAFGSAAGIDLAEPATEAAIAVKAVLLAVPALAACALVRRRAGFLRRRRAVLTVSLLFAAAYTLFMTVFLPLSDIVLPVRYLLPLFPPLLAAATVMLDELAAAKKTRAAGPAVLAIVASLWLAQQADAVYRDTRAWLRDGEGYTSRWWLESDVLRYLRANRLDGEVWTSDPPALYFHTELRRVWTISLSLARVTEVLANRDPAAAAYLVLFKRSLRIRGYDYGLDDVGALPGAELVADLNDGAIFRFGAERATFDGASFRNAVTSRRTGASGG